jgi:hypothetical protein
MNRKNILATLLILSLSTIFILISPGNGICIDKTKIDLSEYKGGNTNKIFVAYKYNFGIRIQGYLTLTYTAVENGFHLQWWETYEGEPPIIIGNTYEVRNEGLFEKDIYRFDPNYAGRDDGSGNLGHLNFTYRDPPNGSPPNPGLGTVKPLLIFPYATVEVGDMWGSAFEEKGNREPIFYPRVYQYAVLGLEDVTVPAGTFTDCVKIARFRGNQADRITWYAKGIGTVKMIYAQEEHRHLISGIENRFLGYNRAFVLESYE